MKVVLLVSSLRMGGAERVLVQLANEWSLKGWLVTVITLDDGSEPPFFPLVEGVRWRPLGIAAKSKTRREAVGNVWRRICVLRGELRDSGADVFVSFIHRMNVLTLLSSVGLRVPVVVSERTDPGAMPLSLFWRIGRNLAYRRSAAIVVQSQVARGFFTGSLRRRCRIIPNPVLPPRLSDPLSTDRAVPAGDGKQQGRIVAMGRLREEKGFDLLIQAFSRMAPRNPGWQLQIWGEGPHREKLEKLAIRLAGPRRIQFPGVTRRPTDELAKADIFVLPSRREGFPNSLCEAMACGVACVAFDMPSGPGEIIRHELDGLLVPAGDVDALVGALEDLILNPEKRLLLASKAPEVVARFSVQAVLGMWEETLFDACSSRSHRVPAAFTNH